MAIIKCNNPYFNDSRCNVVFKNGIAQTDSATAIEWFKQNGYIVLMKEPKEEIKPTPRKAKKDA